MKAWEVLKALQEGKKMRMKKWLSHEYIYLTEDETRHHHLWYCNGMSLGMDYIRDHEEWEIANQD